MDDEHLLIAVAVAYCSRKRKLEQKRKRLVKRNRFSHLKLLKELETIHPGDWRKNLRMSEEVYLDLLSRVSYRIQGIDICRNNYLTPNELLSATLRFLATGKTQAFLKFSTPQAISNLIVKTCDALSGALRKDFFKFPNSEEDWKVIAKGFERKCNFPQCLGVIDARHIRIKPPVDSGLYYYNHQGFQSIVLLGMANSNYEFTLCNVGTNGRVSDGRVLENSKFFDKLSEKSLQLPEAEGSKLPYVFVGDDAFTLRPDLLKRYSNEELDEEDDESEQCQKYNSQLSRALRIIENVFGILSTRFQLFDAAISMDPDSIDKLIFACCVLHNFLRITDPDAYTPPECLDREDNMTSELKLGCRSEKMIGLNNRCRGEPSTEAEAVRKRFRHYFSR